MNLILTTYYIFYKISNVFLHSLVLSLIMSLKELFSFYMMYNIIITSL